MPNAKDIVNGKAWGLWVRDAARALVAATTPQRRYVIVRGGFFTFQQIAAAELNNGTPFRFGTVELRWIFDMVARQSKRDVRMYPQLERDFENRRSHAAQKQHTKEVEHIILTDLDQDSGDPGIVVENRFGRVH